MKARLIKAQINAPILAIDASYDHLMNDREKFSLARQIVTVVSVLKRAKNPFSLHVVGC